MRYILIILLSLVSICGYSQALPTGFPTQANTGWTQWGYQQSTLGTIIATRDTLWTPRFCGTMVLWPHAAVDTAYWMWNCIQWKKLSSAGDIIAPIWGNITGTLSNQTDLQNALNLKLNISDTTNKWVQDVYTRNDSLFKFKNGGETFVDHLNENISHTSLTANGNYSQNWSENQWFVDSIGGSFLFRMGGVGSTGTRRKEFRINWGGSAFGDQMDAFNMMASIKKADLSADSLRLGLISGGTGVLSMGAYDVANSTNNTFISYSLPSGLIHIHAKDSIWIKGATPAATADSILGVVYRSPTASRIVKIPLSAAGSSITLNNIGTGFAWLATPSGDFKRVANSNTILWDSTSTANSLTAKVDTSVIATQYDLTQISGVDEYSELLDVTVSSPKNGNIPVYDSITSKWRNRVPVYYNVKDYGAVGDSTTDDRVAIIKARDAAYNGGGVLFFPAGKYRISDSILFLYPIRIQGVGKSGGLHNNQSGGVLEKNRLGPIQASSEIVVTDGKNGFVFERQADETKATPAIEYITMSSTVAPGSATGGAFIVVRQMLQGFSALNCTFYGGYIQINIESGYYQYIAGCHFSAPQKAGLKTANNIRTDTGDFTVTACVFSSGTFSTLADTTRAIWWTSGGGMRIVNNKFDACEFDTTHAFRYDIYATNVLDPTSVFIIADNSIENYTVSGIYLHGVVAPYVRIIQINNNEFTPVGSEGAAIDIDLMEAVSISEFVVRDWSGVQPRAAIKVTNTDGVIISKGRIDNFSSNFDLTGSTDTHVDYMWGGDVAIGTLNTTNIAGVNATLYTTETILGRATTGQFGSGILELASQIPDQTDGDVGYISFSSVNNSTSPRVAYIGAVTQGASATNRGGKIIFVTKVNGSSTLTQRMSIDNTGIIGLNSGYSSGTITGTPAYMLGVTAGGDMITTTGSSQWITTGSDIYFNTGNVGIGDATPDVKLDIETASTGSDGIIVTNTNSGAAARPFMRLVNDAGELGQLGMFSSTHATLANYTAFESTKSFRIGTDAGVASGGTSKFEIATGGFSTTPVVTVLGNGNTLIGTTTDGGEKFQVTGSVALDLGSDATGDVYYRNSGGTFTRLGIGSSGNVLTVSGGLPVWAAASGGITTLNTLTAATQTFATGTSGTDFNISSVTSTHTFNIPSASTSNRGLVTTTSQTFAGTKTFNEGIVVTSTSAQPRVYISGNFTSSVAPGISGIGISTADFTYTSTAGAGTESSGQNFNTIGAPTLTSANAISYTGNVSTVRFVGAPIAAGSTTIDHPWNIFANDVNSFQTIAMGLNEQSGDVTLGNGSIVVYNGSGGNTFTLPSLTAHPGKTYFIKNIGSGSVTIARGGSDNIYTTSSVTSFTIAAGAANIVSAASSFWVVQ